MRKLAKNQVVMDGMNRNNVLYTVYGDGTIYCHYNMFGVAYYNVFKDKTKAFIESISVKNLLLLD